MQGEVLRISLSMVWMDVAVVSVDIFLVVAGHSASFVTADPLCPDPLGLRVRLLLGLVSLHLFYTFPGHTF